MSIRKREKYNTIIAVIELMSKKWQMEKNQEDAETCGVFT